MDGIIMGIANWLLENIVSLIAVLISYVAYRQSNKVKKIMMLNDGKRIIEILPAWYVQRMKDECWAFGLLTSDGRILVITKVTALSDDGKWLDIELALSGDLSITENPSYVFAIATGRTKASVQVSNIVAAIELITS